MAITWTELSQSYSTRLETLSPKRIIVYISIFLLFLVIFFLLYDIVSIFAAQKTEITSQSFSLVILCIHCFALFLGLLGFTFFSLPRHKDWTMIRWSAAVVVGTLLLSVVRILIEAVTLGFRKETYSLS